MVRIKKQDAKTATRANLTLGWVAFSERLLSMNKLQHALAIPKSDFENPLHDCLGDRKAIIAECCGLLILDLNDMVRYVHRSAREFFDRVKDSEFPDFDVQTTLACIKYLSIPALVNGLPAMSPHSRPKRRLAPEDSFPLKHYAGQYLHKHHRRIKNTRDNEDVTRAVREFVRDRDNRLCYTTLVFEHNAYETKSAFTNGERVRDSSFESSLPWFSEPLQPLHIAVYLGNSCMLEQLINDQVDINALDPCGQSPLIIALNIVLEFIASILLRNGAEVDLTTQMGHRILLHCMEKDYKSVIQQIIGDGTDTLPNQEFLKVVGFLYLFLFETFRGMLALLLTFSGRAQPPT